VYCSVSECCSVTYYEGASEYSDAYTGPCAGVAMYVAVCVAVFGAECVAVCVVTFVAV